LAQSSVFYYIKTTESRADAATKKGLEMDTILLDRTTSMVTDYPDPADYDDETDYICAVPGLADRIVESMKTPPSEWKDVPEECFNV